MLPVFSVAALLAVRSVLAGFVEVQPGLYTFLFDHGNIAKHIRRIYVRHEYPGGFTEIWHKGTVDGTGPLHNFDVEIKKNTVFHVTPNDETQWRLEVSQAEKSEKLEGGFVIKHTASFDKDRIIFDEYGFAAKTNESSLKIQPGIYTFIFDYQDSKTILQRFGYQHGRVGKEMLMWWEDKEFQEQRRDNFDVEIKEDTLFNVRFDDDVDLVFDQSMAQALPGDEEGFVLESEGNGNKGTRCVFVKKTSFPRLETDFVAACLALLVLVLVLVLVRLLCCQRAPGLAQADKQTERELGEKETELQPTSSSED